MIKLINGRVICGKVLGILEDGSEVISENIIRIDKNSDGDVMYTDKCGNNYIIESKVGKFVRFITEDDSRIRYGSIGFIKEVVEKSALVKFYGMEKDWWVQQEELEIV